MARGGGPGVRVGGVAQERGIARQVRRETRVGSCAHPASPQPDQLLHRAALLEVVVPQRSPRRQLLRAIRKPRVRQTPAARLHRALETFHRGLRPASRHHDRPALREPHEHLHPPWGPPCQPAQAAQHCLTRLPPANTCPRRTHLGAPASVRSYRQPPGSWRSSSA